jgi:hypothetical protein
MKFNELSQELQELWTRGVDHSVFNEDWAKMGGACRVDRSVFNEEWSKAARACCAKYGATVFLYTQRGFIELVQLRDLEPFFWSMPTHSDMKKQAEDGGVSMATPSECAEAGIDYVPFMGWRDIESAPKNVRMLMRNEIDVGIGTYERNLMQTQWMPLPLV